jgi:hypothetical protein
MWGHRDVLKSVVVAAELDKQELDEDLLNVFAGFLVGIIALPSATYVAHCMSLNGDTSASVYLSVRLVCFSCQQIRTA